MAAWTSQIGQLFATGVDLSTSWLLHCASMAEKQISGFSFSPRLAALFPAIQLTACAPCVEAVARSPDIVRSAS
jgi:hypothetical protein